MNTTLAPSKTSADPVVSGRGGKNPAKHFTYIDALRGYAILGVMAIHASSAAPDFGGVGRSIVNQGGKGRPTVLRRKCPDPDDVVAGAARWRDSILHPPALPDCASFLARYGLLPLV